MARGKSKISCQTPFKLICVKPHYLHSWFFSRLLTFKRILMVQAIFFLCNRTKKIVKGKNFPFLFYKLYKLDKIAGSQSVFLQIFRHSLKHYFYLYITARIRSRKLRRNGTAERTRISCGSADASHQSAERAAEETSFPAKEGGLAHSALEFPCLLKK
jgi:hypothetical protein